jgi:hypothetical protein
VEISALMIQNSEQTVPRNHYTTAPLVITRDTNDLATKAYPYKRNQEHKQEQERKATKIVSQTDDGDTVR